MKVTLRVSLAAVIETKELGKPTMPQLHLSVLTAFVLAACKTTGSPSFTESTNATSIKTFSADFSTLPPFVIPHRYKTTKQAASLENGHLSLRVGPGMNGASTDRKSGTERAMLGQALDDRTVWIRQSFRVRAAPGFQADARTMVSQIKFGRTPPKLGSPPIAVYLSKGGEVKCNDYSSGTPSQDTLSTSRKRIQIDDGEWHDVTMELILSDTDGLCRVTIDGVRMIEMSGIDTHQNGNELVPQIGIYRDNLPYPQTVHFDDWRIESSRSVPEI